MQYRPYTHDDYAVEGRDDYRAATLFELDNFYTMAREKKRDVVLIARQCGVCGKSRARALRPLLPVPKLKVWSKLVLDVATARDLLSAEPVDAQIAQAAAKKVGLLNLLSPPEVPLHNNASELGARVSSRE